jgi:hypothetical protein
MKNRSATIFAITFVILGIFIGFLIFASLFAGSRKTALIIEIIAMVSGFFTSLWLSKSHTGSWYIWSLLFGIPILVQGLFWGLSLIEGKDAGLDIAILISSGFVVIISGLTGGRLGRAKSESLSSPNP